MPTWIRSLHRALVVAMLTGLLAAACTDNVASVIPERYRWQVRLLAIAVAVAGLARVLKRRRNRSRQRSAQELNTRDGCGPSRRDVRESANLVLAKLGDTEGQKAAIFLFMQLLLEGRHIARVSEDVCLQGDLLTIDVAIEVSLDTIRTEAVSSSLLLPDKGLVVVPILRRKELALERFEARDSADNRLTHLSHRLTDGWLAWAIKSLYQLTHAPDGTDLTPEQHRVLYRLIGLVCRTDIIDPAEFAQEYDSIVGTDGSGGTDLLRSVCGYFAGNTVSAIEVDVAETDQFFVRYQYAATAERLASRHDRNRTRWGLRPFRYFVPISWAYYADAYDLRITGPASHFVYRHYLSELTAQGVVDLAPNDLAPRVGENSGTGVRLDRNEGAPYTGMHTRNVNRTHSRDVFCVVEFEEIPPGALRRALVISAVCSFVTIAFAFAMPVAVHDSRGTDMAALLLAAPGLAATLVGLSPDRVQQSSLTTFGGLAVSAVLSFVTSILYLGQTLVWQGSVEVDLAVLSLFTLPRADAVWLVLAAVSMGTTAYLASEGSYRMHRYIRALRKQTGTATLNSSD